MNLEIKIQSTESDQLLGIILTIKDPGDENGDIILQYRVDPAYEDAFKEKYPGHELSGEFSRKRNSVFPSVMIFINSSARNLAEIAGKIVINVL
jgi:hypothetical protein